jgi:hypothetical protein
MRFSALFAVAAVVTVALAVGFSWVVSSPDRDYLFDGERGLPRPEVAAWWRVSLPSAVGAGVLATSLLLLLSRAVRTRDRTETLGVGAVAILSGVALAGGLYFLETRRELPPPSECSLAVPGDAEEVFLSRQWKALSPLPWHAPRSGEPSSGTLGPLRDDGVGLARHPGIIPFDPFLLRRLTFVGLPRDEVQRLLGPPAPPPFESPSPHHFRYRMVGAGVGHAGWVFFRTGGGAGWEGASSPNVVAERVEVLQRRVIY